MAVPDAAAWVTTFEITAYLDVIAALVAASATTRLKAIKLQVLAAIMPLFSRLAENPAAEAHAKDTAQKLQTMMKVGRSHSRVKPA